MRVVREFDVLGEGPDGSAVAAASLALAVAGVVAFLVWRTVSPPCPWPLPLALLGCAALFALSLPVHELLHAAGFLLLGPRGTRVRFGCQAGMLYCASEGTRMSRPRFAAVLLAPAAVLTPVYAAVGCALGPWSFPFAALVAALHLSGAAGDLAMCAVVARTRGADLCEDTESGIRLLARD